MKKFTFFAFTILLFSACTKEYITEENYITKENYTKVNTYTKLYTVSNNQWTEDKDASGTYYYCDIDEPNLTEEVFDNGIMVAYLYYQLSGSNVDVFSPLPFSDFINIRNEEKELIYKWEEQVTVEFNIGHVVFIMKFDDHAPENPFYESYDFVVKFMW